MRAEVLRKISDAGFPAYKLAHTIARFQNELRGDKKEIVDILAHGLIKSSQREDLIGMFFAVEPLWGSIETPSNFGSKASSAEAFDFVQRAAKFIRAVDDRVQQMLAKVGKYGCTIEYPEQSQGIVPTVNLTYHEEVRDASSGNKSFERKRDEIRKWLEGESRQSASSYKYLLHWQGLRKDSRRTRRYSLLAIAAGAPPGFPRF